MTGFFRYFQGSVTSSLTTSTGGLPSQRGATSLLHDDERRKGGGATGRTDARRRFSNLSNLAQSLPSTASGSSGFPVAAGSLDLEAAKAGEDGGARSNAAGVLRRRRGNQKSRHSGEGASAASGGRGASDGGGEGVRRTRSALETRPGHRRAAAVAKELKERRGESLVPGDCDSEDDGKYVLSLEMHYVNRVHSYNIPLGSKSPLLVRESARETDGKDASSSSKAGESGISFDPAGDDIKTESGALREKEESRVDGMLSTEKFSKRKHSWSQTSEPNSERRFSGPYLEMQAGL